MLIAYQLQVQQPSTADLQNAIYNGGLHTVFVTGTLRFAADGNIIWCNHTCPGSWNDSDTSLGFRNKLLEPKFCPDTRIIVVSDSAFPCSSTMVGRILTPLKDGDLDRSANTAQHCHVCAAGGRVGDGER
ncbi:hypothetical protein PI125_g20254 [Phytophthora idaei]|nr:hypothetical protein PI125_g20254 [Phytophthora idaei]